MVGGGWDAVGRSVVGPSTWGSEDGEGSKTSAFGRLSDSDGRSYDCGRKCHGIRVASVG
jgi:hypothetical protein